MFTPLITFSSSLTHLLPLFLFTLPTHATSRIDQAYYACCTYEALTTTKSGSFFGTTTYTYVLNLPGFGNNDTGDPGSTCVSSDSCGQVAYAAIDAACDKVLSKNSISWKGTPSFMAKHDTYVTFELSSKLQGTTTSSGVKMPKCIASALNRAAVDDGFAVASVTFECVSNNSKKVNTDASCQGVVGG